MRASDDHGVGQGPPPHATSGRRRLLAGAAVLLVAGGIVIAVLWAPGGDDERVVAATQPTETDETPPASTEIPTAAIATSAPAAGEVTPGAGATAGDEPATLPADSPTLSDPTNCAGFSTELSFTIGTGCVFQQGDRPDEPTVAFTATPTGDVSIAGTLVGAGWMTPDVAVAAIIGPQHGAVLELIVIDDPAQVLSTGIPGRTEGSQIQSVTFFDDGFVVTDSVDLATRVTVYDPSGQPLTGFVSPTDRDLGYPPDPYIQHGALSPDGVRMAWVEREWPPDGSGDPSRNVAIVVADAGSGAELGRVTFELDPDVYVRWVDFDGRWAAVSFVRYGTAGESAERAGPVLIDTAAGVVYALGTDAPAIVTFER